MSTGILIKSLLVLVYAALYGVFFFLCLSHLNDLMVEALLHLAFIAFVCFTYDIFYPYMLMAFSSSRDRLPEGAMGELVVHINRMHEQTDLESLLTFVNDVVPRLLHTGEPVIFVDADSDNFSADARRGLHKWVPGGIFSAQVGGEKSDFVLRENHPVLCYARSTRRIIDVNTCPPQVAEKMRELTAALALPGHGEQGLLCLFLLTGPQETLDAQSLAFLNFFHGQLQIALERIDHLRRVQLRKEAVYQEKMSLMSTLSATIAHEMRTPLSGVRASISAVEAYLPDLLDAYVLASDADPERFPALRSNRLETLQRTPQRITSMVDQANAVIDLLLVNLRDQKLDPATFVPCSMSACIDEAMQSYPFKRNEQERVRCDTREDFSFLGISSMMVYVLFNLLKNALYSVEAAGKGSVVVALERGEKHNFVLVTDTGLGIDAKVLSHIFEGFFTTKSDGTGAGLAFCKRTLLNFGGDINVESQLGMYTTFTLSLPRLQT